MILVTGATGLVGGNLIWYLLQENDRVSAIRRFNSNLESLRIIFSFYTPNPDAYLARIDWKTADLLDVKSISEVMTEATIVYHCAAIVSFGNKADILYNTNVLGTENMIRCAIERGVKKFCFVSSIASCGKAENREMVDENTEWKYDQNRSIYSLSKYYSEQEIWKGIDKGLDAIIVNPGVILGVSGTYNSSSQLFSMVRKGLMFYTSGGSGYVDVQDVVKAMIQLTNSKISGQRFILVGENCSSKEVLSWMADGFGKHRPFIPVSKRLLLCIGFLSEIFGKIFHFSPLINRESAQSITNREFYSSRKIESELSFKFNPIEKCIKEVCEFQLKS